MIDQSLLDQTGRRLLHFIPEWRDEFPLKIHERGFSADGTPRWSGQFARWITRGPDRRSDEDHPETRLRLTRAMRQLRKVAPREHETVWRIMAGETVEAVCQWLNDRAIAGGHPERYSIKDTIVLIISGTDKLAFWY